MARVAAGTSYDPSPHPRNDISDSVYVCHGHLLYFLFPITPSLVSVPVVYFHFSLSCCLSNAFKDNNSSWEHFQSGEWGCMTLDLFPNLKGSFSACCTFFVWLKSNSPSFSPPFFLGGRGSYSDIGGPVVTTQVTIPKDVSKTSSSSLQYGLTEKYFLKIGLRGCSAAGRLHHR